MSPRAWLVLLGCMLSSAALGAERIERRIEVLSATRFANNGSELQFQSGQRLSVDFRQFEIIDLSHPARPARRSLKLAPSGTGVVLDLRRDEQGQLRFGRLFLLKDEAAAAAFLRSEFRHDKAIQETSR